MLFSSLDFFTFCCRHFWKWRMKALRRPWWPITLPVWLSSEAERSTCSSAITANSRRIKRTPTTRSVAQQMMSPTLLRSVSYFLLQFFLASLTRGGNPLHESQHAVLLLSRRTNFRFLTPLACCPSVSSRLASRRISERSREIDRKRETRLELFVSPLRDSRRPNRRSSIPRFCRSDCKSRRSPLARSARADPNDPRR